MPNVVILQLSDAHIKTSDDLLVSRWEALCRSVSSELEKDDVACVVVFCGDATFSGKTDEFAVMQMLLDDLREHITYRFPKLPVHILTVPGNHDCDLTSEDESARLVLRQDLDGSLPRPSISRVMLEAQKAYVTFSEQISTPQTSLTIDSPFYKHYDLNIDGNIIRFHLLNSSWTSILHEQDDLRYPIEAFKPPNSPDADFGITILHHPLHWFLMPAVRRPLRDIIDRHSELVLTGHEHEDEKGRRLVHGGGEINYVEGGVLQDGSRDSIFNIIRIKLPDRTQTTRTMLWVGDHFEPKGDLAGPVPIFNPERVDRKYRLKPSFERWLDELEDPLTHPRIPELRLSHLFAYPDLRKVIESEDCSGNDAKSHAVRRIRSDDVLEELLTKPRVIVSGGDRSGKTSLCKRLYSDSRLKGLVPVYLKGSELGRSGSNPQFRRCLEKAITSQYQLLTPAAYEQLANGSRVLILDDLQDGPEDHTARRSTFQAAVECCDHIILVTSDDLYLELISQRDGSAALLMDYQRYEICDFGYQRLEALAYNWIALGRADPDPATLRAKTLDICQQVQSALALAGLPHTPWLLTVVLEHSDFAESPGIAARSGNYGHLYHAVITVALSRTKMPSFDLNGRFLYLAELAHRLYVESRSGLSEATARAFHIQHCERYDLPFDYERVRDDFDATRMIRVDGDEIFFRSKWVYCFFVAWWLSRNIRLDEAKEIVNEILNKIYDDTSANILVFLAHLSEDPLVLKSMRSAASSLFSKNPKATISEDVKELNRIGTASGFFQLPATPPEVNRKLLQEMRDDAAASEDRPTCERDATNVPEEPDSDERKVLHEQFKNVRAALKTINILGQVLRNGATSIESPEKVAIMDDIISLGRRVLGGAYSVSTSSVTKYFRSRVFRILFISQRERRRAKDCEDNKVFFTLRELRELRNEAESLANSFWFNLHWLATFSIIKRIAYAIGLPLLDNTIVKLIEQDDALPNRLVHLNVRLLRRGRNVPVEEMVQLHKNLAKVDNRLARVVLEAMSWERLLLFDTKHEHSQSICQQMGIKIPVQTLDPSRKKFSPPSRRISS